MSVTENASKIYIYIIILAVAFVAAYGFTFDSKQALLGDNASYYSLGKALAQGEGYVNISRITKSPNNHYPPGYPAIISTVLIFTDSIVAVKLLNGLLFGLSIGLIYLLVFRLTESRASAFVISLMAILNSHLLFYSSLMMSEVPFMFFSLLSIYFYTKIDIEKAFWRDKYLIGAILTMIIAYYIRSLGIALLAGFFLHWLFKKGWKYMAISLTAFVLAALPWFLRGQKLGGGSYMKQLQMINPYNPGLGQADMGDFMDRMINNFTRYFTREIPDTIFTFSPKYNTPLTGSDWFIGLLILVLIGFGIYKLKSYRLLIAGYLLGTLAILMIWPDVWIGVRFIVPIIPLFLMAFVNGFVQLIKVIRKNISAPVYYAPLVILLFTFGAVKTLHDSAKADYPPAWKRYFEVATWLKTNGHTNAVVSCGKPSLFYTYSGSYTMRYKFTRDAEDLIANLEQNKVDYVVIDQVYGNTFQYLLPAVRQHPERFQQVLHLKNPDTFLLKFKR
ncbi:MAG TPA: phospholipid carrier-dependent glycosyltransferase [Fulvivirga sp.]|nr:phospholipid carrier-dependent glycosyltransferase [Fulvivirga sp.]